MRKVIKICLLAVITLLVCDPNPGAYWYDIIGHPFGRVRVAAQGDGSLSVIIDAAEPGRHHLYVRAMGETRATVSEWVLWFYDRDGDEWAGREGEIPEIDAFQLRTDGGT